MSALIPGEYLYGWDSKTHCPSNTVPAAQYFTIVSGAANKTFIMLTCVGEDDYIGTDPEKKKQDDLVLGLLLGLVLPVILFAMFCLPCICQRYCRAPPNVRAYEQPKTDIQPAPYTAGV